MPRVRVLEQYCKGCGLCVEACPKNVLCLSERINRRGVHLVVVREEADCTACLNCAVMCPDAALEVEA